DAARGARCGDPEPAPRRPESQQTLPAPSFRCSQGQPPFASAIGDRCDAACVLAAAAVEDDCLDTGVLRALCDELADLARLGGLVAVERAQIGLHGRGRSDGDALRVVDDLNEDVASRAVHDEAGTRLGADDLLAQAGVATDASSRTTLSPRY